MLKCRTTYFVGGYHHGMTGFAEVSHAAFNYSKWHVYSVIVSWPFMILAGLHI